MARHSSYRSTQRTRKGAVTKYGSRTDIGSVREQNEDSLIVRSPLFVVADGMGGHAAGEVASEIAVRTIEELAPDHADAEALGRAVEAANRDIINAALEGKGREGMGTTVTAAILEGNRLVIAQVGDSRAYLLHNGQLSQLTRDHSLMANMIEAGQITPEEARFHPSRSVITRALGNDPDTVPDLYEINVEEGDRLLLCSDGLYSMLEDDEIAAVMRRVPDPQRCATTLTNGAIAAGGFDNITVIIADAEGLGRQKRRRVAVRTKITIAFVLLLLAGIIAGAIWGGSTYLHNTAYLTTTDSGMVAVYRGVPGSVLGFSYSELVEETDIPVSKLSPSAAARISENMRVNSVDEAKELVNSYREEINKKQEEEKAKADAQAARSAAGAAEAEAYEYDEGADNAKAASSQSEAAGEGTSQ